MFQKINFYPHNKFLVKPTFARILLHVKFVNEIMKRQSLQHINGVKQ